MLLLGDIDGADNPEAGWHVLPGSAEEAEAFLALDLVEERVAALDLGHELLALMQALERGFDEAVNRAQLGMLADGADSVDTDGQSEQEEVEHDVLGGVAPDGQPRLGCLKPKRRERKLEYALRQGGWEFERRRKRVIYRRVRHHPEADKEHVMQAFAVTAQPKDPRHRKHLLGMLNRLDDPCRDHFSRKAR